MRPEVRLTQLAIVRQDWDIAHDSFQDDCTCPVRASFQRYTFTPCNLSAIHALTGQER